jgi:uncharacterized protein involved in exopolysaccharide biosynthesis
VVISAYVPREVYDKVKELAESNGRSTSEAAYELIRRGLEAGSDGAADPPDPADALQSALRGLEPLERERVLQFIRELEGAEEELARLGPEAVRQARAMRITTPELTDLDRRVRSLKRIYERVIRRSVRSPEVLDVIGERLLRLMKELGVPV